MANIEPNDRLDMLYQRAGDFPFNNNIPLFRYARSTREMERMAVVYASEQQFENSYVLYTKMLRLIIEKVPKHPQYKSADKEIKMTFSKRCTNAFGGVEKVKKILIEQFTKEFNEYKEEKAREEKLFLQKKVEEEHQKKLLENRRRIENHNFKEESKTEINTTDELNERFSSLKSVSSYPNVPLISTNEREQPQAPPPPVSTLSFVPPSSTTPPSSSMTEPSAPSIPSTNTDLNGIPENTSSYTPQFNRSLKPSLPTNEPLDQSALPPPYQMPPYQVPSPTYQTPSIDRSKKPETTYNRQDSLSSLDGNRNVIVPGDLTSKFLQVASSNTIKNLETCGILAGKLSHHQLHITHVVIPKQTATSDSCTTESEEEMFDIQDKYDLITLGWIHTHPSQTSFLSSVDLHTQCSYQQLMPEAIAIVCAPKFNQIGIYRLTPNYGLNYVTKCTKTGFHPHPKEPPLFEDSPLVSIENSKSISIIDLR